jgi:hypothetical protein
MTVKGSNILAELRRLSESAIPTSLFERFGADQLSGMLNLLRFLGPITTVSQGDNLGFMRVV